MDQDFEKKQKHGVWHIDPNCLKHRARSPFDWGGFGRVCKATYEPKEIQDREEYDHDHDHDRIGRWIHGSQKVTNKNRPVAVKELRFRLDNAEMDAFRREIDIWHKLKHPQVLPLLGACDTTPKPFMISPWMPNGTLKAYLARKPGVEEEEKIQIMAGVASAMAYLHENNIIHGGISSTNVLLNEHFQPVISGFGLARTEDTSESSDYATHGHNPAGTLQYMAPEMLDWNNPSGSSKKTDVYAYGILFYEVMINGGAVWVTEDGKPMLKDLIPLQVTMGCRPERYRPDLQRIYDDNAWSFIQACWHQYPQERRTSEQVYGRIFYDFIEVFSQGLNEVPKRHLVWHIDPKSVKDREDSPFDAGGFGQVYKATYNHRTVAVKVLLCRFGRDEMDAFRQEIDIWHKLEHPRILPLLGACDTETEIPFMVSPLMPNGTLQKYVFNQMRSVSEKLRIMGEVASGMVYLHEKKIIHGDISSRNILLDENMCAVISDFGLARTKHISSNSNYATHDQKPKGTLQYMAPEMLRSPNPLGSSKLTDVYAYGILLYEVMINGSHVWVTADDQPKPLNEFQIALQVTHDLRPKQTRPDLQLEFSSGNIWHLIEECWHKAPEDRPSFELVLARTQEILSGDSLDEQIKHCSNNRESHDTSSRITSDPNMHSMQLDASTMSLEVEKYANGILSIGNSADMAARLCQQLPSAGDRESDFELAWLHMSGVGAEQSDEKALGYWQSVRTESNNNNYKTIATFMAGMCHYLGIGTELDLVTGRKLITEGASDEFPLALLAVEEWKADCMDWCGKVDCWAGNPENEILLSSPASEVFFQRVILGSEKHSLLKHLEGVCYFYGFGTSKDRNKAIKILDANRAFCASQTFLGAWNAGMHKSEIAKQWFTKAAEQKHADAQYYLGLCFCQDPFNEDDLEVAVQWFEKAADQDHALAQYKLGYCLYRGIGVSTKEYSKAAKWFQKAADQGHAKAQTQCSLEECYTNGYGIDNRVNGNGKRSCLR